MVETVDLITGRDDLGKCSSLAWLIRSASLVRCIVGASSWPGERRLWRDQRLLAVAARVCQKEGQAVPAKSVFDAKSPSFQEPYSLLRIPFAGRAFGGGRAGIC